MYLQQLPELYLQQLLKVVVPKDNVFINIQNYELTIHNFNKNINNILEYANSKKDIIDTYRDKIQKITSYNNDVKKLKDSIELLYIKAENYVRCIESMIYISNIALSYFSITARCNKYNVKTSNTYSL